MRLVRILAAAGGPAIGGVTAPQLIRLDDWLIACVQAALQSDFMEGELRVVVATVAFGMGIDKKDVRWVASAARLET